MNNDKDSLELRFSPLIERLQEYFESAKKRNDKFSLRAFARKIGMPASTLSTIMKFPKNLTETQIEKIAQGMSLTTEEIASYKRYYAVEEIPTSNRQRRKLLTPDEATKIAPWHVGALFELMRCRCFRYDLAWLSDSLNVSPEEITEAVDALVQVGLIEISENGVVTTLCDQYEFTSPPTDLTYQQNVRKHMIDLEKLSIKSLEDCLPRTVRFHGSLIMPFHVSNLALVKKLADRFRLQVSSYTDQFEDINNQIYALTVSCYPLSKN